jgi:hypothetical protein
MPKICVMFFGLFRCLSKTLITIRENIFIELEKQGIEYDLYIHSYCIDTLTNSRSNENIKYDNGQYKLFKYPKKKIIIDSQDEIDKSLNFDIFLQKNNPWPEDGSKNTMKNLLRQLYSLKRVFTMVKNSNIDYDGYLFLRPDMVYLNKLSIRHLFPLKQNNAYIPTEFSYGGYNDRICFTSKYGAEVFSSRFDVIYNEDNVHSETFLCKHFNTNNIFVDNLNLHALRVRADGNSVQG